MKQNTLTCLCCGTVLQAPKADREMAVCKCKNRAWIQKRPESNHWAYGSVDFLKHQRNTKDEQ